MRTDLIELRESAGLTMEDVAERLPCNVRSVARWEAGSRTPQMAQRLALARVYGVPLADVLRALRLGGAPPVVHGHRVDRFGHFVALEQGAAAIDTYEPVVLPGLMQSRAYASAVEATAPDRPSAAEIARRVDLRLTRQGVLSRLDRLRAVIDTSVLLRADGVADHLRTLPACVEVRVLPLGLTAAAGGHGGFTLLTGSDDALPFTAVTTTAAGIGYHDDPAPFVALFAHLWEESRALEDI